MLEELGRSVAPVPYLTSAVIAVTALLGCDHATRRRSPRCSPRSPAAAPSACSPSRCPPPRAGCRSRPYAPTRGRPLDRPGDLGRRRRGAPSSCSSWAQGPDGPALYAVEASADGVRTDSVTPLDLTRPLGHLTFDGAHGRLLATGDRARAAVERALLTGAGLLASEQLGRRRMVPDRNRAPHGRAHPVRPSRRLVPGAQAPDGRALAGGGLGPRRRPQRRRRAGHRQPRRGRGGGRRPGVLRAGGGAGRRGVHPAARRHRHDLGAPGPSVPQAGQERRGRPGVAGPAPRRPWRGWSPSSAPRGAARGRGFRGAQGRGGSEGRAPATAGRWPPVSR